jgi:hypothetical protein
VSYRTEPAAGAKPVDSQPTFFGQPAAQGIASSSISGLVAIKPVFDRASGSDASVPAQQASVNAVMGMLSAWNSSQNSLQNSSQKAQHAAP